MSQSALKNGVLRIDSFMIMLYFIIFLVGLISVEISAVCAIRCLPLVTVD